MRWIRTVGLSPRGAWMPVDVQPIYFTEGGKGTYITEEGKVVHGTECVKDRDGAKVGYTSHFATCPNADKHRRKR